MKQLPTAEAFIEEQYSFIPFELDQITELMLEFAKLHVQAALESAAENSEVKVVYVPNDQPSSSFGDDYTHVVDKQSILNAYSLDNIK